jgi:hypothetical protein
MEDNRNTTVAVGSVGERERGKGGKRGRERESEGRRGMSVRRREREEYGFLEKRKREGREIAVCLS